MQLIFHGFKYYPNYTATLINVTMGKKFVITNLSLSMKTSHENRGYFAPT